MLPLGGLYEYKGSVYSNRLSVPYGAIGLMLGSAESLVIIATGISTGGAYHFMSFGEPGPIGGYVTVGALVAVLYCAMLKGQYLYKPAAILCDSVRASELLAVWSGVFAFSAVAAFSLKTGSSFSRGAAFSFYLIGFPVVLACRKIGVHAILQLVDSHRLSGPRIAVVFEPEEIENCGVLLDLQRHGYRIIKSFPIYSKERCVKVADELTACARTTKIDEVLVVVSWRRRSEIEQMVAALRPIAAPVRLLADREMRPLYERAVDYIGPILTVNLRRAPLTRSERALKRLFDLTLSCLLLIVLSPLFLLVGALIWLDSPGPVLFRQKRIGFNGQAFSIIKFRTMSVLEDGAVVRQARVNDPRITRIGRWLRRTSIDELPQLINVLRGEMSLVGPRPHAESHDNAFEAAVAEYALRQHVRPGITGWAQINGARGETPDVESLRRRVRYDLWYIDNWSIPLELRILAQSVLVLLDGHNAV